MQIKSCSMLAFYCKILGVGGFRHVAQIAGLQCRRRAPNFWNDLDNVVREMKSFIQTQGKADSVFLPSNNELMRAGRQDLRYAIQV